MTAIIRNPSACCGERYRLIRGQAVGFVTAAAPWFYIDQIQVLAGGKDPRSTPGNPSEQVQVFNVLEENFPDNSAVTAIYNGDTSGSGPRWEVLLVERYRMIRGTANGAVTANQSSFTIKNIIVIGNGVDPRTDPSDPNETITVTNSQKETFTNGEYVTAVFFETGFLDSGWQTLPIERYRAIRGTWYSGTTTLQIKNVVPLESGLDPRSNPADPDEIVSVDNLPNDNYASGDTVVADYNPTNGHWEARSKGVTKVAYTANISSPISAGTASAPIPGTATVYRVESGGSTTSLGTQTLYNPYQVSAKGHCACVPLPNSNEAKFLISGIPAEEKQIFALNTDHPCDLTIDDDQLVLTLHGKLLTVLARLDQDNVDKTCELGAVVCGEVV